MSLFNKNTKPPKARAKKDDTTKTEESSKAPVGMKELYSETAKSARTKTGSKKATAGRPFAQSSQVLIRPLITEKATQGGAQNKYAFVVARGANKIMVARSVEAVYGVQPTGVNISNVSGKKKRTGRIVGKRSDWKKAVVSLPAGRTIQIYEGV